MTDSAESHFEEIRRDLACPYCEYNLRGLVGVQVTCPECARPVDVAEAIMRQWRKSFWKTPGFSRVILPAMIAVAFPAGVLIAAGRTYAGIPIIGVAVLAVTLAFWSWSLRRAYLVFPSRRGVYLITLGHSILIIYFASLFGLAFGVAGLVHSLREKLSALGVVVAIVVIVIAASGFLLARRIEESIARQCLKRHIELQPEVNYP